MQLEHNNTVYRYCYVFVNIMSLVIKVLLQAISATRVCAH